MSDLSIVKRLRNGDPHLGAVCDEAADAIEAMYAALTDPLLGPPIPSKYHGQSGFDLEHFLADYAHWRLDIRGAALRKVRP